MKRKEKIFERLKKLYGNQAGYAWKKIEEELSDYEPSEKKATKLTQEDTILITYGDTIISPGKKGLEVLKDFLEKYVGDAVSNVHLLPMYPFTSDDGFSVTDYREINPDLGTWKDVKLLSEKYGLMFDAVINHISRSSRWFKKYLEGEAPYTEYFITCDPDEDYSRVTRPRALPLLTKVETAEGKRHVWTTFSTDQIDLNFACPEVMAEILNILVGYARAGARFIRLDAIGFLWKKKGTTCMHLPETHEAVKLMKDILKIYEPDTRIITETNVPHEDNISYFGNGSDEADLVYQFPLPPLTMFSILKGNARVLSEWMKTLTLPGKETAFFNFLSSHDGIGVRPTEGILTAEERQFLVDQTLKNGGEVSYKDNGDGTRSPYELNINYQDALASPEESDEQRIDKFLAAETILLSMQGIPGIYIHSLLGSRNDYYGKTVSGIPRRINREKLDYGFLSEQLEQNTNRSRIFWELIRRLKIRKEEEAFSPGAGQRVLDLDERVLALERTGEEAGARIYALINVSGETITLEDERLIGKDLLTGASCEKKVQLPPYGTAWIKE